MIKGIIFDLDGVLLSTDKYHFKAWKAIADQERIYFDESINNQLRGVSRMESLEIILRNSKKKYTLEEKKALAEKKNDIYRESLKDLSRLDIDLDVVNTLETLKKKGLKLGIGSSSKNTRFILERTELIGYFDAIADGTQITKSKPDPEVFILAKDLLSLETDECLVIEDAKSGIDAAFAGGFASCGIKDAKDYHKTTYGIDKVSDILDIIEV